MSQQNRPFVWQMVRDAMEALGTPTTNVAVRDGIVDRYPDTNIGFTLDARLMRMSRTGGGSTAIGL